MSLLDVKDLSVAYGELLAVRQVSLSVEQGGCVSILGANGAGKSSLLKALVGVSPVSGGDIVFEGASLRALKSYQIAYRGVMYCPEGRRLFPDLTVLENLRVGGHVIARKEVQGELDRIFEMFPVLAERRHQKAGSMSGGEQQMCAIGRALMSRPRLLLLDEPSLGLAPMMIATVAAIIRRVKQLGITVVLVEQNAKLALRLSDYAYILESGSLVREGSADALAASQDVIATYLGG